MPITINLNYKEKKNLFARYTSYTCIHLQISEYDTSDPIGLLRSAYNKATRTVAHLSLICARFGKRPELVLFYIKCLADDIIVIYKINTKLTYVLPEPRGCAFISSNLWRELTTTLEWKSAAKYCGALVDINSFIWFYFICNKIIHQRVVIYYGVIRLC